MRHTITASQADVLNTAVTGMQAWDAVMLRMEKSADTSAMAQVILYKA